MTWIILALLGVAALILVFSLFKKLVKLAFTAVALLLVAAGIWYFWQQAPEIPDPVRQAGEGAVETLKEAAGEAVDAAGDVAGDIAGEALSAAAEAAEAGAERAMERAADVVEDAVGADGDETREQQDDPAEGEDERPPTP